ncbi:MAG TPA: hypothetical protein VF679_00295, partial [Pedobacter sp.]
AVAGTNGKQVAAVFRVGRVGLPGESFRLAQRVSAYFGTQIFDQRRAFGRRIVDHFINGNSW